MKQVQSFTPLSFDPKKPESPTMCPSTEPGPVADFVAARQPSHDIRECFRNRPTKVSQNRWAD